MIFPELRIAMISAHSCPVGNLGAKDTGGMSVYIRELARELGRQGHSVDIYTRIHNSADPQVISIGERARLIHLQAGHENDIHKLALYYYLPEFTCNLENYRKDNSLQYDIVFSHYWLSGWVGKYLQQWWQVPHVTMFHTVGAIKNSIGIGEDEPELRIVTERESVNNCQRIIATTAAEREDLVRYYDALPEKIGIVPCGVNMEHFQPVDKVTARQKLGLSHDKILLFVGRIDPLKGVQQLLKAIPHLRTTTGLKLIVIGGDEDSVHDIENLKKLASALNIRDAVTFLGLVKHEELPYFYSAADVCIVPSYYESFGLVALESLACGTPVLATDVGDLSNIIRPGETGYILADNNPESIADRIDMIFSGTSHDMESALSIKASVSEYSWENIAGNIIQELRLASGSELATVA